MVELQQLCDKVPSFPSDLAFATICEELSVNSVKSVETEIAGARRGGIPRPGLQGHSGKQW